MVFGQRAKRGKLPERLASVCPKALEFRITMKRRPQKLPRLPLQPEHLIAINQSVVIQGAPANGKFLQPLSELRGSGDVFNP
jgi:hypothetical protein